QQAMNIPLTPIRFLRYAQEQYAQRTAVVCGKERFTYTQFAERVSRVAGALREAGVEAGDRVAFLSGNCHRLLEAYYGVLEAGALLLPLNIRLAAEELTFVLMDAGARALFFQSQFLQLVESFHAKLPMVKAFYSLDERVEKDWVRAQNYEVLLSGAPSYRADVMDVGEDGIAELFYTSGTTAEPKGVMLTHRNIYLHAFNAALS